MDDLFEAERVARVGGDTEQLAEIQRRIISSCSNDDEIIHALRLLMNKRKQDHGCIKQLVKDLRHGGHSLEFYSRLLSEVIEGRIFLEEERLEVAFLIKKMAISNIWPYYDMLKNIPVETFTTISEKKKNEFIFEQIGLALSLQNFRDAEQLSRRIKKNMLSDEEKEIYLNYMVILKAKQKAYLEASRLLLELQDTAPSKNRVALSSYYCILSSCFTEGKRIVDEKHDLLEKLEKNNRNDPTVRTIISSFRSNLMIDCSISSVLTSRIKKICGEDIICAETYETEFKRSVAEHNFFIVEKFVSRIHMTYLSNILGLSIDDTIEFISEMVNENYTSVRINQQDGIVNIKENSWSQQVDGVLDKIAEVSILIHKETL